MSIEYCVAATASTPALIEDDRSGLIFLTISASVKRIHFSNVRKASNRHPEP
jgi:hypothetical protein